MLLSNLVFIAYIIQKTMSRESCEKLVKEERNLMVNYGSEYYRNYNNDNLTKEGALRLADKIKQYWKDRGKKVILSLEKCGNSSNFSLWGIRSDMINGKPR